MTKDDFLTVFEKNMKLQLDFRYFYNTQIVHEKNWKKIDQSAVTRSFSEESKTQNRQENFLKKT